MVKTAKNTDSVATQTKMHNQITVSKSTFKYNCNQIMNLQSKLANVKCEKAQFKKYADDLEKAMILSEARHSSEIDTLSKKIKDFETLIAAQRLEIMELRVNNQNDHETNNCNIELLEQIDDTNVQQTFEAINKDLSS